MGTEHPVTVARKAKGWRLVDLAQQIGRSAPLISQIEHGYIPKPSTQVAIAVALDRQVEDLFPEA